MPYFIPALNTLSPSIVLINVSYFLSPRSPRLHSSTHPHLLFHCCSKWKSAYLPCSLVPPFVPPHPHSTVGPIPWAFNYCSSILLQIASCFLILPISLPTQLLNFFSSLFSQPLKDFWESSIKMLSNNSSISAVSELTSMDCCFVCPGLDIPSWLPWESL